MPGARLLFSLALVIGASIAIGAQAITDSRLLTQLKQLFPSAQAFSPKGGDPPHFKAFNGTNLLGLAFWTTELQPLERAYDGPIKILVGMDTKGILTGIIVVEHHEPYGNFSIDTPGFSAQFRGKNIRDAFKVGADIDAISRATISVTSSSRSIRNSARLAARQLLTAPAQ